MAELDDMLTSLEDIEDRISKMDPKILRLFSHMVEGNKQAAQQMAANIGIAEKSFDEFYSNILSTATDTMRRMKTASQDSANIVAQNLEKVLNSFGNSAARIRSGFEAATEGLKDFTSDIKLVLNTDETTNRIKGDLQTLVDANTKFLSEHAIDIGKYIAFDTLPKATYEKLVPKTLQEAEGHYREWGKSVGGSIAGMSGAFDATENSTVMFGETVASAMRQSAHAINDLGISSEMAKEEMGRLLAAGMRTGEIPDIEIDTGDAVTNLRGLSASLVLAKATGQDSAAINNIIVKSLRELGREAGDVDDVFAAIKITQQGTNLSYKTVQDTLMQGAESLKFYGTNLESMTGLFKSLTASLGQARAGLAVPMFKNLISGLEGMSDATKGFLALSSGMTGPGGALAGILEMEDALAGGRIDEVIDRIQGTVERMSGGKMLTREQAKATGQEDQFFLQRQLLAQMTGVKNAGELLTQFQMGAARGGLAGEGRAVISAEEGPIRAQFNRMMGESVNAMADFTEGLVGASAEIDKAMINIIADLKEISGRAAEAGGKKARDEELGGPSVAEMRDAAMRDILANGLAGPPPETISPMNLNLRPGDRIGLAGTGMQPANQLSSALMMNQMGMTDVNTLNSVDVMQRLNLFPADALKLDIEESRDIMRTMQQGAPAGGSLTTSPGDVATAVGKQKIELQAQEEPIKLKIEFITDNQGNLSAEIKQVLHDVALEIVRKEVNGD